MTDDPEGGQVLSQAIVDGETAVLLSDPLDLAAFGAAVCSLLDDPARAEAMGREAKQRVVHRFLGTRTLIESIELAVHPRAGLAGRRSRRRRFGEPT